MKTTKKLMYVILIAVIAAFASCKGEIGPAGPAGADGADGTDGIAGTDGTDGNANVQTYIYNNPAWGISSGMNIDMTDILTDTVISTDAILTYVKHTGYGSIYSIPGSVWNGNYRDYAVFLNTNDLQIVSLEMDGGFTSNANLWAVDWVKVVIIESTNTTIIDAGTKSLNNKQAIYYELDKAGVDINNYYQVMDYYGLEY